jgi:cation-transporting ATPase F
MATLHRDESGRIVAHVKGAVERLLGMAAQELRADGSVTAVDADAVHARADELAGRALGCWRWAASSCRRAQPL